MRVDKLLVVGRNAEQVRRWAEKKKINILKITYCDSVREAEELKKQNEDLKLGIRCDIVNVKSWVR